MKIFDVDFPEPLLNALRDGHLVVFAGAGVSMGPPANLPDFRTLATQVAEGTGETIAKDEAEDRFLGRLKNEGCEVHQRVAHILQRNNPEPTALHNNLLRFFGEPGDVRVVTTNFDDLFERSALGLFNPQPKLFQAPALPLGNRFCGIVHLHGSVNEPEETVITDQNFGRAYLTEADGWARRFLVDLFASYTVLFVGYRHKDTIMTYLTPSLPPDGGQKRFALVGDQSDDLSHWRRMGIEPVTFHQADDEDFHGLNAAVEGLANFLRRGVLDWQKEITAIASGRPPIDDRSSSIIEHALTDPVTTRFFTEAAESPDWLEWLDRRCHLLVLFNDGKLNEQDRMLIWWAVSRFAMAHDNELFSLIERHGGKINAELWRRLVWKMQNSIQQSLDESVITRWVLFLANTIPPNADDTELSWLSESCAGVGATDSMLQVYWAMTEQLNRVPPYGWRNSVMFHHEMQKILSGHIKPNLREIAEPLLALATTRLKARHAAWAAWEQGDSEWSPDDFHMSAIEPHEQDKHSLDIDALIDMARECLEWLTANSPVISGGWCDRHINSDAPLLRRLAIHSMNAREDLTGDDKIAWLLDRCDVNETAAHHEIFRAAAHLYPQAGFQQRKAFIQAVSQFRAPENDNRDSDRRTAYYHFNWFHWLHKASPDCGIAKEALDTVWMRHLDFSPREHPDLTYWTRTGSVTSPWAIESLLGNSPKEILADLLAYHPNELQRFEGQDRSAMLGAINQAAKANPSWGLDLADAMVEMGAWDSDLWYHVITAWSDSEFDHDGVGRLLSHLSANELHKRHVREIASALSRLVRKNELAEEKGFHEAANEIAWLLRPHVVTEEITQFTASVGGVPQYVSWLQKAINHTSGQLALFWTHSIELLQKQQEITPSSLSAEYRDALDAIITDAGVSGKFGRSVLASSFQFFLAVDENWTVDRLLPLFGTEHEDFQCAWDGFLTWGRLSPPVAKVLGENFVARGLAGFPRIPAEDAQALRRVLRRSAEPTHQ